MLIEFLEVGRDPDHSLTRVTTTEQTPEDCDRIFKAIGDVLAITDLPAFQPTRHIRHKGTQTITVIGHDLAADQQSSGQDSAHQAGQGIRPVGEARVVVA